MTLLAIQENKWNIAMKRDSAARDKAERMRSGYTEAKGEKGYDLNAGILAAMQESERKGMGWPTDAEIAATTQRNLSRPSGKSATSIRLSLQKLSNP